MTEREKLTNARCYIESWLKIRTKDAELVPLKLNPPQARLYAALKAQYDAGRPMRVIVLKARQLGFSTLAEALLFHRTATQKNVNSLIVAHREDSTANLFKMSKLFLENLPGPLRPMTRTSNAQELLFENPEKDLAKKAANPGLMSRLRCQTAGGKGIGRSDTLQNVHASEFAFWSGDKRMTWAGIMQAVPALPGTLVILESTANGYDEFHALWQAAERGESDFEPLFFPWFENGGYRMKWNGGPWTARERELAGRFGLDDGQLAWRRWCIQNNCAGDERLFRQEYPSCPEEAFLTTGEAVFDNELASRRLARAEKPGRTGFFTYREGKNGLEGVSWTEREDGCVRIWEEPREGRPYVIGGDTAGTGSDYFAGQVLDNVTGRQAAVLHHRSDEDLYARQMYCLGLYYNEALIGVETNYSTYPVKTLANLGYPKLYVREVPDTFTGSLRDAYGWDTNARTRPVAVAQLVEAFRQDPEMVADPRTLGEMLTFQYNADHRPEAAAGEHDDLVMALAIANAIRAQQRFTDEAPPARRARWSRDMREDYEGADPAGREAMLRAWGVPGDISGESR